MGAEVEAVDKLELRELLGTTDNGKEIYLVRSGGQLPKQLAGGFSSVQAARQVVASYLAKIKHKQIKADGTAVKSKGRDSK